MKYRLVLLLLIVVNNFSANAKPKLVTSITPVASLVAMLTEDEADVVAINISSGCPHHYQMKPSDKEKVFESKMLIYIDDSFDSFAGKIAEKFKGKVVKISSFRSLNFQDEKEGINWHFWLDLNNVLAFHDELAAILIKEIPELKTVVESNKSKAHAKIRSLIQLKYHELASIKDIVVVSDSLEHFFKSIDTGVIKLYKETHSSLRDYSDIEYTLGNDTPQCIVIDSAQDDSVYKKFNKRIVKLDSENWINDDSDGARVDLFYRKYLEMIELLKECVDKS
ncbi:MAG: zinc ABC transporter substrate-binding protein [Rickettsiaceae bacterium]|jgi:zinc transport system substrate-binding protein|nr:zinc ABC transporter substrate-binding protein [Rickettsiaceae bacterium]